jgi:acyl-CoA synthetase (AMP-forming)/AMP-acid ligase II
MQGQPKRTARRTPFLISEFAEKHAAEQPDKTAIIRGGRSLTYGEIYARSQRLAGNLSEAGIGRGDLVAGIFYKTEEVVLSFIAASFLGALFVPVNYRLEPENFVDLCRRYEIKVFLAHADFEPLLQDLAGLQDRAPLIVFSGRPRNGSAHRFETWLDGPDPEPIQASPGPDDPAYINFTSGSTGRPKGAVTTHRNLAVNTSSAIKTLRLRPDDVHLCMFAVYAHPHELFYRSFFLGGTTVFLDSLTPRGLGSTIERCRVTAMMGIPPIYEMQLKPALMSKGYDLSSLRILEAGGMPTPESLIAEMREDHGLELLPVWGSTETAGIAVACRPGEKRVAHTIGRACPGYDIRVVNDSGEDTGTDEVGEMMIRSQAVMAGYHGPAEETARAFSGDWYLTGDLVRRNREGYFFFEGRKDEMFKVGGMKVFPLETERVILSHAAIREAVVIPVEERARGEIPKALIVCKDGDRPKATELKIFCRKRLASHKIPRKIEFVSSLPKLANGKIDRAGIRKRERADEKDSPFTEL